MVIILNKGGRRYSTLLRATPSSVLEIEPSWPGDAQPGTFSFHFLQIWKHDMTFHLCQLWWARFGLIEIICGFLGPWNLSCLHPRTSFFSFIKASICFLDWLYCCAHGLDSVGDKLTSLKLTGLLVCPRIFQETTGRTINCTKTVPRVLFSHSH